MIALAQTASIQDRIELECLIGAARTAAILLDPVVDTALRDQDRGQLKAPMSEPHEDALSFCAIEVKAAVEKLYNRVHGLEGSEAQEAKP